jgi:small subunit ribosomal protein S4
LVAVGQTVSIREKSQTVLPIQKGLEGVDGRGVPTWLELDKTRFTGRVKELPTKEEIALPVNEQLVVELYSR